MNMFIYGVYDIEMTVAKWKSKDYKIFPRLCQSHMYEVFILDTLQCNIIEIINSSLMLIGLITKYQTHTQILICLDKGTPS